MGEEYPNLVAPIGTMEIIALEAIMSGNRGKVAYDGKIWYAKAKENIAAYKECVVVDEGSLRGIAERRSGT